MPWTLVPAVPVMATLLAVACAGDRQLSAPLNVLLILVDDLGWTDVGVYGSRFYETPAIDGLARSGVRFTEFYTASPVCSPTRASLMSGKHPARLGITDWIGGAQRGQLLPPPNGTALPLEEVTIGEAFAEAGYVTGYVGKWHLGTGPHLPSGQGFMEMVAVNDAGQPGSYFSPYRRTEPSPQDVPDLASDLPGDYLTDRLTDVTLAFLERHADDPFFFVLSHYAVHTPLQAPEDLTEKYAAKADMLAGDESDSFEAEGPSWTKLRQDHPTYAAMIESTDRSVGRVLDRLDDLGLTDRTAVVFVSDNGGLSTLPRRGRGTPTANLPLRSGKGWLYEGGIRVPLLVRWPGVTEADRQIEGAASTTDLYPTLLAMAGLPARPDQHLDGRSLAPALRGDAPMPDRPLYWHFPHYHGSGNTPSGAIRMGPYKLIEWFEDDRIELYRVDQDLGERTDLVDAEPDTARRLRSALEDWRAEIGAALPDPNPDWQRR